MKKYFLILFFILSSRISYSQITYHFPHDSATWGHFSGFWGNGIYGYTKKYLANGDTLHNNFSYIKIERNDTFVPGGALLYAFLREDSTNKVWVSFRYPFCDTTERLLYDFNISIGDSLIVYGSTSQVLIVDSITNILLDNGETRKCFHMLNGCGSGYMDGEQLIWIEGIGSNGGLFNPYGGCIIDGLDWLTCFHHHDTLLYHTSNECYFFWGINNLNEESFFKVSQENSKTFLLSISKNISSDCELEVMDLLGRKVFTQKVTQQKTAINLENLPAGCYVFSMRNKQQFFRKKVMVN